MVCQVALTDGPNIFTTHTQIKASLLRPSCFQNKKALIGIIFFVYCWLILLVSFMLFLFFPAVIDRERKEWPTVIFLFVSHVCRMTQDMWHVCTEIPTSPEAKFNWFKPHTKNWQRSKLQFNIWFRTKVEESVWAKAAWAALCRLLDSLCGVAVLGLGWLTSADGFSGYPHHDALCAIGTVMKSCCLATFHTDSDNNKQTGVTSHRKTIDSSKTSGAESVLWFPFELFGQ